MLALILVWSWSANLTWKHRKPARWWSWVTAAGSLIPTPVIWSLSLLCHEVYNQSLFSFSVMWRTQNHGTKWMRNNLLCAGGWNLVSFKGPSTPNQAVILRWWFSHGKLQEHLTYWKLETSLRELPWISHNGCKQSALSKQADWQKSFVSSLGLRSEVLHTQLVAV